MSECDRHVRLQDESDCGVCLLEKSMDYFHLSDLRKCDEHARPVWYDADFACPACHAKCPTCDLKHSVSAEDRVQANEAKMESNLEKSGDHGRQGATDQGYRWL